MKAFKIIIGFLLLSFAVKAQKPQLIHTWYEYEKFNVGKYFVPPRDTLPGADTASLAIVGNKIFVRYNGTWILASGKNFDTLDITGVHTTPWNDLRYQPIGSYAVVGGVDGSFLYKVAGNKAYTPSSRVKWDSTNLIFRVNSSSASVSGVYGYTVLGDGTPGIFVWDIGHPNSHSASGGVLDAGLLAAFYLNMAFDSALLIRARCNITISAGGIGSPGSVWLKSGRFYFRGNGAVPDTSKMYTIGTTLAVRDSVTFSKLPKAVTHSTSDSALLIHSDGTVFKYPSDSLGGGGGGGSADSVHFQTNYRTDTMRTRLDKKIDTATTNISIVHDGSPGDIWNLYPSSDGLSIHDKPFSNDGNVQFSNKTDSSIKASVTFVALRVGTITSSSTPTPTSAMDQFNLTALAAAATFAAPTGTFVDGQSLLIRIKDNATARALSWNAIYRASTDFALPTTTVISKTMYVQFVYNAADTKFDCVGLTNGF